MQIANWQPELQVIDVTSSQKADQISIIRGTGPECNTNQTLVSKVETKRSSCKYKRLP